MTDKDQYPERRSVDALNESIYKAETLTGAMHQDALPEIALSVNITGPCFTFTVEGGKEQGKLEIQKLRVVGSTLEGIPTTAFEFDSALEPTGMEHVATLLAGPSRTVDASFLGNLLSLTNSYSCGSWRSIPLHSTGSEVSDASSLRSRQPSFEAFCAQPGILSREFECHYRSSQEALVLEADILSACELLEIRIFTDSDEASRSLCDAFKVLLQPDTSRTCQSAYGELKGLLTKLGSAFTSGGYSTLAETINDLGLDVFMTHDSNSDSPYEPFANLLTRAPLTTVGHLRHRDGAASVRYQIRTANAVLTITSDDESSPNGARFEFAPGPSFKTFTAAQLRQILASAQELAKEESSHSMAHRTSLLSQVYENLVQSLSGNDRKSNVPPASKSSQYPGQQSLSELQRMTSIVSPGAGYFFSSEGLRKLTTEGTFCEQTKTAPPIEVVGNSLMGGRYAILKAKDAYVETHPHRFSLQVLAESPHGDLYIRVFNRLGGSYACVLDRAHHGSTEFRAAAIDAVYEALTTQHLHGPQGVIKKLRELSDSLDSSFDLPLWDPHNATLPSLEDSTGWETLEMAGHLAYLLKRSGLPGLEISFADRGAGIADIHLESVQLGGAIDIRLADTQLIALATGYYEQLYDKPGEWIDAAAFRHAGYPFNKESVPALVESLRGYMRDQRDPLAMRSGTPQMFASRRLETKLTGLLFKKSR